MNTIKQYQDADHVIRFLKGLNDDFASVQSQVFLTNPLSIVNQVFSMAITHERLMRYASVHPQLGRTGLGANQVMMIEEQDSNSVN